MVKKNLFSKIAEKMQGHEYMQGQGRQDSGHDRAAGQRSADCSYPEFGPVELVEEINCNFQLFSIPVFFVYIYDSLTTVISCREDREGS